MENKPLSKPDENKTSTKLSVKKKPRRGEIWTIDLGEGIDHESKGIKLCLIISVQYLNKGGNIIVVPLRPKTTPYESHIKPEAKDSYSQHNLTGYCICEDVRGLSPSRLGRKICSANKFTIQLVTSSINKLIGFEESNSKPAKKSKRH